MKHNIIIALLLTLLLSGACGHKNEQIAPKPKGYFRIDLPKAEYTLLDTTLPFTMEVSQYAQAIITPKDSGKIWIDLQYPQFAAEMKMTYFPMHGNLRDRMVQEREMVQFHYVKADDVEYSIISFHIMELHHLSFLYHYVKADDVEYSIISDPESRMFGQIYDIEGSDVATPFQFWVSDSSHHFLRGSLYFNFPPNNDSIQPVIDYLRNDLLQLVNTLQWR